MNRLPGIDNQTRRSELIAFSILGVVALGLIAFTAHDSFKFAAARERIAYENKPSPLSRPPHGTATDLLARSPSNHVVVRPAPVAVPEDQPHATRTGPTRPQT